MRRTGSRHLRDAKTQGVPGGWGKLGQLKASVS